MSLNNEKVRTRIQNLQGKFWEGGRRKWQIENKTQEIIKEELKKLQTNSDYEDFVLDYKNPEQLRKFVNEKGKILPRRATGACAKHQRDITQAVKRARHIAVLPYTQN